MTRLPFAQAALLGAVATVTLARPERHNALVPELLDDLLRALDGVVRANPRLIVLAAEGRSFSTGGDVAAIARHPRGDRRRYAERLVGRLNDAILALNDVSVPVIARVQGAVTGGAVGLMLAADTIVMSDRAFVQPYYSEVGFAPDGGWTFLVPERIGLHTTLGILHANRRILAEEAFRLGLVETVVAADHLDDTVARQVAHLVAKDGSSLAANRLLMLGGERRGRLMAALAAEKAAFLDLIETDAADAGMRRFLEKRT